jgi:glycosyltransferase involved in cell wall biosynthesis
MEYHPGKDDAEAAALPAAPIQKEISNMRIGVIATLKRGIEHFIYRELRFLEKEGFSISLYPTKNGYGLYNPDPTWSCYRWHVWDILLAQPSRLLRAPLQYLNILYEAIQYRAVVEFLLAQYFTKFMRDVDVLYTTFGDRKLFVGYFCKRISHKPLVTTIHAYELYQNPNQKLFMHALAECDQIITISDYNREYLATHFHIDQEHVEIVRYIVDLDQYQPSSKFVVMIVGSFVERKGHDILFRAVKETGREDIEVWVVGDSGAEQTSVDVHAQAKYYNVESQVVFWGPLRGKALEAIYRQCDIFCLPCRTDSQGVAEGFPVVLIEAMAHGKPVITTRHVEIPRIIPEIVVEENDIYGLAAAIEQLYQSSHLRERLGLQNRQIAEQYFSSTNINQTAHIFKNAARKHS